MDFAPLFLLYIAFSLVSFLCCFYIDDVVAVLPPQIISIIMKVKSVIVSAARRFIPSPVQKLAVYVFDYVFQTRNQIFVVLYIFMVLSIHLTCGLGCLPYLYAVHRHTNHMFWPLFFLTLNTAMFLLSWLSDPGYITARNVSELQNVYEYDAVMYKPAVSCVTCKQIKPARSKHCTTTDQCIFRFDHYCAWVGNAVGVFTHRWFVLYTGTLAAMLGNAIRQLVQSLTCITSVSRLWSLRYMDAAGDDWPMDWPTLIQTLFMRHPYLVFLTFALTFTLPVICVLCGYHIYLIATNQTTNERYKKHSLKRKNKDLKTIRNPYNKGLIQNFAEVLYPEKYLFNQKVTRKSSESVNGHQNKKLKRK